MQRGGTVLGDKVLGVEAHASERPCRGAFGQNDTRVLLAKCTERDPMPTKDDGGASNKSIAVIHSPTALDCDAGLPDMYPRHHCTIGIGGLLETSINTVQITASATLPYSIQPFAPFEGQMG